MTDSTTSRKNSDNRQEQHRQQQQQQQHVDTRTPEWIEKAHAVTRSVVSNWIRSVFQESCLQMLKARLVAHNHQRVLQQQHQHQQHQQTTEFDNDKDKESSTVTTTTNHVVVVVTPQDLEVCVQACRRLGHMWSQKLQQRGIDDVSQWMETIMANDQFLEIIMGNDDSVPMENDEDDDEDDNEDDNDHEIMETKEKDNAIIPHVNDMEQQDEKRNDDDDDGSSVMNILKHKGNDVTKDDDSSKDGSEKGNTATLVLTKLQRLGEEEEDEEEEEEDNDDNPHNNFHRRSPHPPQIARHPKKYIRILDKMGREESTLWPYGWDVIERAAQRNTKRIHMETISGRPKPASRVTQNYEVVLKDLDTISSSSLSGKHKNDDSNDKEEDGSSRSGGSGGGGDTSCRIDGTTNTSNDDHHNEETPVPQSNSLTHIEHHEEKMMMPWAVQRTYKKRKLDKNPTENNRADAQPPLSSTRTASEDAVAARQPSLIQGEERWSWKEDVLESIPEDEQEYLQNTMIRNDNEKEPSNSILGALKNVGHVHLCLEGSTRFGGLDILPGFPESPPPLPDTVHDDGYSQQHYQKVRRDHLKQAKNERLGPFRQENKYAEYKARQGKKFSKVVRTMNSQQQKRYVELDLGECLLHIKSSSTSGRRMTCAFSTLEVSLEDATGL